MKCSLRADESGLEISVLRMEVIGVRPTPAERRTTGVAGSTAVADKKKSPQGWETLMMSPLLYWSCKRLDT